MSNILNTLSLTQLQRAVAIKEQIASLETELGRIFGSPASSAPVARRARTLKLGRRARATTLTVPKGGVGRGAVAASKGRKKMSKEARARLSASATARWAKVRAAGKKSLKALARS